MFLALSGPMYAGKTKLALALEKRGFLHVAFSDLLKRYAVEALTACGMAVTLESVLSEKGKYRPFLQELGSIIGFSTDPKYVIEALTPWSGQSVVFDNCRTQEQWETLQGLGFVLVEVRISDQEQLRRAKLHGVAREALGLAQAHSIEGRLAGQGDVVLDGAADPTENVLKILGRGKPNDYSETPAGQAQRYPVHQGGCNRREALFPPAVG